MAGLRCDSSKLLLDPYGKSFEGRSDFTQALFSYDLNAKGQGDRRKAPADRFAGPHHDERRDQPVLRLFRSRATDPYHETIIYEAHVRGMTQCHPAVPEQLRGTYAGWPTWLSSTT